MATSVKVFFRDGTHKEFPHRGRAGGSYTKRVEYGDGVVTIIDEWGNRTTYPLDLVKHVEEEQHR